MSVHICLITVHFSLLLSTLFYDRPLYPKLTRTVADLQQADLNTIIHQEVHIRQCEVRIIIKINLESVPIIQQQNPKWDSK